MIKKLKTILLIKLIAVKEIDTGLYYIIDEPGTGKQPR
jgi:hypothetical protein